MALFNVTLIRAVYEWKKDRAEYKRWKRSHQTWVETISKLQLEEWIRLNPEFLTAEKISVVLEEMASATVHRLQEEKLAVLLNKVKSGNLLLSLEAELQAYSCMQAYFCDLMASKVPEGAEETEHGY